MEIEHINDDTIRVKIANSDLADRGITFLDLLGNQNQIEKFFYSILEEVDIDDEFKDSEAVTFQVMPKNNGLELFISKGTQVSEEVLEELTYNKADNNESTPQGFSSNAMNDLEANHTEETPLDDDPASNQLPSQKDLLLVFNNIEQVIMMAKEYNVEQGDSSLYFLDEHFYLHLKYDIQPEIDTKALFQAFKVHEFAHALEFGNKSNISPEVIMEHGEVVIEEGALVKLAMTFD